MPSFTSVKRTLLLRKPLRRSSTRLGAGRSDVSPVLVAAATDISALVWGVELCTIGSAICKAWLVRVSGAKRWQVNDLSAAAECDQWQWKICWMIHKGQPQAPTAFQPLNKTIINALRSVTLLAVCVYRAELHKFDCADHGHISFPLTASYTPKARQMLELKYEVV